MAVSGEDKHSISFFLSLKATQPNNVESIFTAHEETKITFLIVFFRMATLDGQRMKPVGPLQRKDNQDPVDIQTYDNRNKHWNCRRFSFFSKPH